MIRLLLAVIAVCFGLILDCTPDREFGFRYTEVIDLNGSWLFKLDDAGVGIAERWFEQVLPDTVSLPGSTDENGYGTPYDGSIEPPILIGKFSIPPTLSWMTRRYSYVGPAWYQREIVIPDNWNGKRISLFLERCHWESQVWVDGQACGMRNSLSTPHTYELPYDLKPGTHWLTIRVDNSIRLNIGASTHAITPSTQSNWNGVIGRMELQSTDPIWIKEMHVYPNAETGTIKIVFTIDNLTGQPAKGSIRLSLRDARGKIMQERVEPPATIAPGESQASSEWQQDVPIRWEIHHPELLEVCAELKATTESGTYVHDRAVRFGMRSFTHNGNQLLLNGRVTHLRGTLECCIFPLTGYPAMDVDAWLRIFQVTRSYGLNHMRFHSWCPPDAAFEAADRMGMILQVEAPIWVKDLGRDSERDHWLEQEVTDIFDQYGDHPSFCMFSLGNELSGDRDFIRGLMTKVKERDPRHLYTASSGGDIPHETEPPLPCDEYLVAAHRPGASLRGRNFVRRGPAVPSLPETATDYRTALAGLSVPVVVHEMGHWAMWPDFREIEKYTGVLRPRNLEIFRDSLAAHHMLDQAEVFVKASGALSSLLYKEEIEANLRTPGIGGFQLLDLRDFPGQGTAYVGILDPFWDSKGLVSAEEHRRYCGDIVPLARMERRTWTNEETFSAGMEIAHYGAEDLKDVTLVWSLTDQAGAVIFRGEFPRLTIRQGGITKLGIVQAPLQQVTIARRLKLQLEITGTEYRNGWDIWVYPGSRTIERPKSVVIAGALDAAVRRRLQSGNSVLLLPKPETLKQGLPGWFTTVSWSPIGYSVMDTPLTMGLLCDPDHPALAQFPTEFHTDWQWWELVTRSRALVLENTPPKYRPIVQVIDHYNRNLRLGSLFEARVGTGRLMVSAFDLSTDLDNRPVARQLLRSILAYMASESFQPQQELAWEVLQQIIQ